MKIEKANSTFRENEYSCPADNICFYLIRYRKLCSLYILGWYYYVNVVSVNCSSFDYSLTLLTT